MTCGNCIFLPPGSGARECLRKDVMQAWRRDEDRACGNYKPVTNEQRGVQ